MSPTILQTNKNDNMNKDYYTLRAENFAGRNSL